MSIFAKKIVAVSTLLLLPVSALAACPTGSPTAWFNCIFDNIINNLVWPVFAALIVIMTIVAGILFITARGNETQISTARRMAIWIAVGIVVGLAAFSIEGIVTEILGV